MSKKIDRRDFIKGTAAAGAALALGCQKKDQPKQDPGAQPAGAASASPLASGSTRARVVVVRDQGVLDAEGKIVAPVLEKMLDEGVAALLTETDAQKAWAKLLAPNDVLGIKSNVWKFIPTPAELEEAVRKRAMAMGIKPDNIAVDDRGVLDNAVFQRSTALINLRTLRTHHWSGIGSCLKNYIMFHPEPSSWHEDSCANLAGLWSLPVVKGKTRLNVQVVLTPLFHGKGPHHYQAEYTWQYKGLILGSDPVAVDATALRLLEAKRREHFGQEQPFSVPPKHIQVAQDKYNLGVADPKRIDLIKLGWGEGVLI